MTEPLESLYPKIGQTVMNIVAEKWDEVTIHIIVKPGVIQLKCSSINQTNGSVTSFAPNRILVGLFRQLHERMVTELYDDWITAEFKLKHNGKFDISFGYEG